MDKEIYEINGTVLHNSQVRLYPRYSLGAKSEESPTVQNMDAFADVIKWYNNLLMYVISWKNLLHYICSQRTLRQAFTPTAQTSIYTHRVWSKLFLFMWLVLNVIFLLIWLIYFIISIHTNSTMPMAHMTTQLSGLLPLIYGLKYIAYKCLLKSKVVFYQYYCLHTNTVTFQLYEESSPNCPQ